MAPTTAQIKKQRRKIDKLKNKFERNFKSKFRTWQKKVHQNFNLQVKTGTSVVTLINDQKKDLDELMHSHYIEVAEGFVPGLKFSDQVKQLSINGVPISGSDEDEDDDHIFVDFLIPQVLRDIEGSLDIQIGLQFPVHYNSIVETTERIGNDAKILNDRDPESTYSAILASKLIARETTVSVTETNWIAESSMNTALLMTTPSLAIATQSQLKELQKISPNTTLKNTDIDKLFETESDFAIQQERRKWATPQKTWITMRDTKVRATHQLMDGVTIPVNQPFQLPGGLMMYPADSSLGVSFKEIVNCRCHAMYS